MKIAELGSIDPDLKIQDIREQDILHLLKEIIESKHLGQLLVIAVKDDGTTMSCDNGLSVDEALELTSRFQEWLRDHKRKIV